MAVQPDATANQLWTQAISHSQAGRLGEAASVFRRFLALTPDHAGAHYNLAVTLKALGRLQEAGHHYQRTLAIKPNAKAYNNLGVIFAAQGNPEEAAQHYRRALDLTPDYANAHYNYANLLKSLGDAPEAIAHYVRALSIAPDDADTHNNLGVALAANGEVDDAITNYRRAIQLQPGYASAYSNLGSALEARSLIDEAIENYTAALDLDPRHVDAHYNLAHALDAQDRSEEAQAHYERALAIDPMHAQAHNNFGVLSQHLGRFDEALARYRRAQALKPDYADAHWNEALTCLLLGDFETGWRKYAWRWRRKETPPRAVAAPLWDGAPLVGKTILLHTEQGAGDTFQFIRYAPLVKALGASVVLACPKGLHRVLAGVDGVDLIVPDDDLPSVDCHAPLLSLPGLLCTTLETIPTAVRYLQADDDLSKTWLERLYGLGARRVGVAWRGNPAHSNDRRRSIPVGALAPWAHLTGVDWISLQIDARPEELAAFDGLYDGSPQLGDWADTAALISTLDLVVTVDTAVAHLAGALSKPVWVLLAFAPDWRWRLDRTDSPWYPTMRLFRQPAPGDWMSVVHDVAAGLTDQGSELASAPKTSAVRSTSRRLRPVMVVSHERSGTHFFMNALSYAYGYTAHPWIDLDTHNADVDLSSPLKTAMSLKRQAADPLFRIVKSHHSAEVFGEALERIAETYTIFYVYRHPSAVMTSLWRHLKGLAWDEGPKVADPLTLSRTRPSGRLVRYQTERHQTMLQRWAAHVEGWLDRIEADERVTPVRYEDLDGDYEATVSSFSNVLGRKTLRPVLRPRADVNVISMGHDRQEAPVALATRDALEGYCESEVGALLQRLKYRIGRPPKTPASLGR